MEVPFTHTHTHTHTHTQVSDLDEVAMGSEERQELESKVEELEEKVDEYEKTQKDVFLTICQRFIGVLSDHLTHCDQEGTDYETAWFLCTLDNCRQLLVQVGAVSRFCVTWET